MKIFRRFHADLSAATAVEYGILTGLIAVGMLVGVYSFSDALNGTFKILSDTFNAASAPAE